MAGNKRLTAFSLRRLRPGIGKKRRCLFLGKPEVLLHAAPPVLPIRLVLDRHFEHCKRSRVQFLRRRDGIDRARLKRPLGAMLRAKNDPFGAWPQAGQSRQADGAAIAGEQTQRNLRKADFRGA